MDKISGGENGEAIAYGNALQPTLDGGYIHGETLSSHSGDVPGLLDGSGDVWVVKLDQTGNIQWQNRLGGTGNDFGTAIKQTSHGDYILTEQQHRTTAEMSVRITGAGTSG